MSTIPIMVITENGEAFNYFEGVNIYNDFNNDIFDIYGFVRDEQVFIHFPDKLLRNKVLELIHEEVGKCFETKYNSNCDYDELLQTRFQIYLKDIIERARKEIE